jgi:two-component system NarL family sensor kinase
MRTLLDRFAPILSPDEASHLSAVRAYLAWQASRRAQPFAPDANDDVDIRTYLLEQRIAGATRKALESQIAALKHFYAWAETEGLVESSPFEEFNFDRPLLSRDQIRRRQDRFGADPQEREIARLRALNRLAEQLNRATDVHTTLDQTLATLVETMGLQTAWVFLWTEAGLLPQNAPAPHDFILGAACNLPPGLTQDDHYYLCQPPDCHCQWLLREGLLTRAVNVVECTRLQDAAEEAGDTQGLLFHATVPLLVQNQPVGILNVAADEWQFLSAADLQLLSAVGAQTGIVLERARLFNRSAQMGALEERNRLAREIHDTLAQGLAAIALQLETADAVLEAEADPTRARQAVQQALTLTRTNLDEARRSVLDLRAAPLEGRTLAEALAALAGQREWAAKWNLHVTFEATEGLPPLPLPVESGLYRIAQEALTNAARHAHARRVAIQLATRRSHVHLAVSDDGRGFDPAHIPPGRYGLVGLNERAKLLGGSLRLESSLGQGTRVEVSVPIHDD